MKRLIGTLLAFSSAAATCVCAQSPEPIASADVMSRISIFSYREGPKSDLFLRGTLFAPMTEGRVEVEYQDGNAEIDVKVDDLPDPASFGPYTAYVLWALTPDGRAASQGVLLEFAGGDGDLETSYGGSQFALIVTAEPHFAVTAPSTMVVLYNVADDVKGDEAKITTVTEQADYSGLSSMPIDENESPPWLVQARYAVAIAAAAGAERFAPQAYEIAREKLAAAEDAARGRKKKAAREAAHDLAHEAVVASEDARRAARARALARLSGIFAQTGTK